MFGALKPYFSEYGIVQIERLFGIGIKKCFTFRKVASSSRPVNGGRPANISNKITPEVQNLINQGQVRTRGGGGEQQTNPEQKQTSEGTSSA